MLGKLLGITHIVPLLVIFKHFFVRPITVQYPEERLTLPERYRGLHLYNSEKCMGCGMCARICPNKAIELQVSITPEGKKKIELFNIFIGRCIFCGLCVDYCPGRVLTMSSEYEQAGFDRPSLVYGIDRLERAKWEIEESAAEGGEK